MKHKLSVIAAVCAMAALLTAAEEVVAGARFALRLCAELIIPSLFPFFVLSMLLSRLGLPALLSRSLSRGASRLFGVSGGGAAALFIGLTGGYPMGAAWVAALEKRGELSDGEAARLLGFCNNSGPAFIVGAVGAGLFRSSAAGLGLYLCHIASAVLTGLILRSTGNAARSGAAPAAAPPEPLSAALPGAVKDAVGAVLNVCGFAVCFTVFASLLNSNGLFDALSGALSGALGVSPQWVRALLTGLLELSSGVGAMQGLDCCPANLALAAFLLGWGGVSVHFQTLALFSDTDVSCTLHFAGRLISAVLGAVLAFFLSPLFI